jgi:hypothetical protein
VGEDEPGAVVTDRPSGLCLIGWYARLTVEVVRNVWHEIRWWRAR